MSTCLSWYDLSLRLFIYGKSDDDIRSDAESAANVSKLHRNKAACYVQMGRLDEVSIIAVLNSYWLSSGIRLQHSAESVFSTGTNAVADCLVPNMKMCCTVVSRCVGNSGEHASSNFFL